MILLFLRLLVAALLALTGVTTEDVTLASGEVVTDECTQDQIDSGECTAPPSELPGPSD